MEKRNLYYEVLGAAIGIGLCGTIVIKNAPKECSYRSSPIAKEYSWDEIIKAHKNDSSLTDSVAGLSKIYSRNNLKTAQDFKNYLINFKGE